MAALRQRNCQLLTRTRHCKCVTDGEGCYITAYGVYKKRPSVSNIAGTFTGIGALIILSATTAITNKLELVPNAGLTSAAAVDADSVQRCWKVRR